MADSIVVLYRGGRLPSWHQLSPDEQVAFQDEHVDLPSRPAWAKPTTCLPSLSTSVTTATMLVSRPVGDVVVSAYREMGTVRCRISRMRMGP